MQDVDDRTKQPNILHKFILNLISFLFLFFLLKRYLPHFHMLTDGAPLVMLYKQQPNSHFVTFRQVNLQDVESKHWVRSCNGLNLQ